MEADSVHAPALTALVNQAVTRRGAVHRAIRDRVIEALKAEPAAPTDQQAFAALAAMLDGARFVDVTARYRRDRIRAAARARKARRGWR